jgi:hypothetical protein
MVIEYTYSSANHATVSLHVAPAIAKQRCDRVATTHPKIYLWIGGCIWARFSTFNDNL